MSQHAPSPAGTASADPPPLDEVLGAMRVVAIPTRTNFRGISVREAALFEGPGGATEFSPFVEYGDAEAAVWLAATLDFGWGELPELHRDRVEVNATVPAVSPDEVPRVLARFPGCRTAKVKVAERGQTVADDVARLRAVRREMGDDARIRIDANGGWSVDEALGALDAFAEAGIDLDYAEQPCETVAELAELRQRLTGVARIAADESVRKAEDPLAVARAGAADLLTVKAQPLGGVRRALAIVGEAGLPVVVSSALDTSIGIAMGLHLAAALPGPGAAPVGEAPAAGPGLAGACGLGTVALLAGDVTRDSLVPVDGAIEVRRPELDPALLERHAASPERVRWWRERVTRCHALLAGR